MNTTLCWNCNAEYPRLAPRCPECKSTNGNIVTALDRAQYLYKCALEDEQRAKQTLAAATAKRQAALTELQHVNATAQEATYGTV